MRPAPHRRAGEAPSCQSTCEPGETLLAKDGSGDGARCAGDGAKQLCERCQQPAVFDGASVRSPKRCLQRQCGEAKPLTRFTDQPAFVAAAVRTMEGCCALCRAASGCLRFDVGPRGCAIYRTRRSSATVRSRGYTAAYSECPGVGWGEGGGAHVMHAWTRTTIRVAVLDWFPLRWTDKLTRLAAFVACRRVGPRIAGRQAQLPGRAAQAWRLSYCHMYPRCRPAWNANNFERTDD